MTKQVVATLVGGLIVFLWQFLSWALVGIHSSDFQYTANQDKILECLTTNLPEEGTYMLPIVPPGTSRADEEAFMATREGKPWASVTYHQSFHTSMGMNMARAFAIDLLAVFLLVWILMRIPNLNLFSVVQYCVGVGLISYLTIPYLNSIWFETKSLPYLIDAIVQWGLVGLWLGWWLSRK
jgi:hypothetical protein